MKIFIGFILFLIIISMLDLFFTLNKYWFTKPIHWYLHLYDDDIGWEGPTAIAMVVFLILFLVFISLHYNP